MKRNISSSPLAGGSFSLLLIFLLVLGCGFGSEPECTGKVTVRGETYEGIDTTVADAQRNACSKYCIEGDPQTDAMYRIWLDSLNEKERKRVRKGTKGKWDAVYKDERIKRQVVSCEKKCLAEQDVTASCKE